MSSKREGASDDYSTPSYYSPYTIVFKEKLLDMLLAKFAIGDAIEIEAEPYGKEYAILQKKLWEAKSIKHVFNSQRRTFTEDSIKKFHELSEDTDLDAKIINTFYAPGISSLIPLKALMLLLFINKPVKLLLISETDDYFTRNISKTIEDLTKTLYRHEKTLKDNLFYYSKEDRMLYSREFSPQNDVILLQNLDFSKFCAEDFYYFDQIGSGGVKVVLDNSNTFVIRTRYSSIIATTTIDWFFKSKRDIPINYYLNKTHDVLRSFDLSFVVEEGEDRVNGEATAHEILDDGAERNERMVNLDIFRDYILYAKTIKTHFEKGLKAKIKLNPELIIKKELIEALADANARLRLKKTITKGDIIDAIRIVKASVDLHKFFETSKTLSFQYDRYNL